MGEASVLMTPHRFPAPYRYLEPLGLYNVQFLTFRNDEWGLAVYRASGRRNGIDLDIEQAFVIRFEDGRWKEVTAVPLDAAFDAFWA